MQGTQRDKTDRKGTAEVKLSQILSWVQDKLSLSTRISDKTTRQSVSNPSSPKLVRASRLKSNSASNMSQIRDTTHIPSVSESRDIQDETAFRTLEGAISEDQQLRNQVLNNYGESQPPTPFQGFPTIQQNNMTGTDQINQDIYLESTTGRPIQRTSEVPDDPLNIGNVAIDPIDLSISKTRSGAPYIAREPLQQLSESEVGRRQGAVPKSKKNAPNIPADMINMGVDTTESVEVIAGDQQQNQDGMQAVSDQQGLQLQRDFIKWREDLVELSDELYGIEEWWLKIDALITPLHERLEKIINDASIFDRNSTLFRLAARDEDKLMKLKEELKKEAKRYGEEVAKQSHQSSEGHHNDTTGRNTDDNWQDDDLINQDGQAFEEVLMPYSIRMDNNLEQNLASTRTVTNLNTGVEDAKSKADYASEGLKALEKRVGALELQQHKCDPVIYQRLTALENELEFIQSALAEKADLEALQSKVTRQWDVIYRSDRVAAEAKGRVELALGEVRDLARRMATRCMNSNDSVLRGGPDWGSDLLSSRGATPVEPARVIQSSTRIGTQQVRFSEADHLVNRNNRERDAVLDLSIQPRSLRGLSQVDGQDDSPASSTSTSQTNIQVSGAGQDSGINLSTTVGQRVGSQDTDIQRGASSSSSHGIGQATRSRSLNNRMSGTFGYTTMPRDNRINMDARQPLPVTWDRGRNRTPLYTADQVQAAQFVTNREIQQVDRTISAEPPIDVILDGTASRTAKALNKQRLHVLSLIQNNKLEDLDSGEKVKEVYNTCMAFMQAEVKELRVRQDNYQETTSLASQNGNLLDAVEQVIDWANEWLRGIQVMYTKKGCGLKRLSGKYVDDVPVFDGRGDISVHEFISRFKLCFQGEGSPKDKANLLHRRFLGVEIRRMTEDIKDDLEALIAVLMDKFGHPQTVVMNILRSVQNESLPTAADDDRSRLASHLRQLESALTQITNLPSYGLDKANLISYLTSYQCLEVIRERIPDHMKVDLYRTLRAHGLSRTHIVGWDHYVVIREFVSEAALDYDTFQPNNGKKSKAKETGVKKKRLQGSESIATLQEVKSSDEDEREQTINVTQDNTKEKLEEKPIRRNFRTTDQDGYLRCDLEGSEHRKHTLMECQEFWNLPVRMKRSLLRWKACFACIGPREICGKGCSQKPPRAMLCQHCTAEGGRFVPAAVLCSIEEHRNSADGQAVLGAMQEFISRFNGKHYVASKVLDQAQAPKLQ